MCTVLVLFGTLSIIFLFYKAKRIKNIIVFLKSGFILEDNDKEMLRIGIVDINKQCWTSLLHYRTRFKTTEETVHDKFSLFDNSMYKAS